MLTLKQYCQDCVQNTVLDTEREHLCDTICASVFLFWNTCCLSGERNKHMSSDWFVSQKRNVVGFHESGL